MTDVNGTLVARYDYDPYGKRGANEITTTGAVESDFGFTGHYHYGPSALTLALYRAYDPDLGRWLSRDLLGEQGGMNLFQYARNSPIAWLDPNGLDPVSKTHYNKGGVMVHSEVPLPNQSQGGVHIQVGDSKFHFNTQSGEFTGLTKDLGKKLLNDKKFRKAIGNACNRVNGQGGFAPKYGGGPGRFIPALAALLALSQLAHGDAIADDMTRQAQDYYRNLQDGEDVSLEAAVLRNYLNSLAPLSGEVAFPVLLK